MPFPEAGWPADGLFVTMPDEGVTGLTGSCNGPPMSGGGPGGGGGRKARYPSESDEPSPLTVTESLSLRGGDSEGRRGSITSLADTSSVSSAEPKKLIVHDVHLWISSCGKQGNVTTPRKDRD